MTGLIMTMAASLGLAQADGAPITVQDCPGYNSWPMVQALGQRLVCAYSRGTGHDILEGGRGVCVRHSDDRGRTWSDETCLANAADVAEVAVGKGLDDSGAMLLWVRAFGSSAKRHDLYRSTDGVRFEKIATPVLSPIPVQVTDVFAVPGKGLMALWFSGWLSGEPNAWGTLVSADGGLSWTQRTVESGLTTSELPTEPSAVWLGNGRILAVARTEATDASARQFQLVSKDFGATWMRERTNIGDISLSTPSLVYESQSDLLYNYYYERGKGMIRRRVCLAGQVLNSSQAWPVSEVIGTGSTISSDAGNVNATVIGTDHYVAYYSGKAPDTAILIQPASTRPAPDEAYRYYIVMPQVEETYEQDVSGGKPLDVRFANGADACSSWVFDTLLQTEKESVGIRLKSTDPTGNVLILR